MKPKIWLSQKLGHDKLLTPYLYPPPPPTPTSTPTNIQTTCNQQTLSLPSLPPTHAHTTPRHKTTSEPHVYT